MPLRLSKFEDTKVGVLNEWADGIENHEEELRQRIEQSREAAAAAQTTADESATDVGVPAEITSPSISESGFTVDGVVWSEVTATYTAPSPLGNFAGVFLVAEDYRGSAELVKVAEHNFAGAAGGSASFNVQLQRTGETVTFYFIAKNTLGGTREDWSLAPNQTGVLDGNASAPTAPSGLGANQEELGVQLSWTLGTETNLAGYNVHRHTADIFGSSSAIANVGVTKTGNPGYFDKTAGRGTTFFYWVTALNTANQESTQSSSASNSGTGVDFADVDGATKPEDNADITSLENLGPGHGSYRPTSNPLTATDAGATATVSIAAFTMRVGATDVSINSGSVTSLSFATLHYIYYDDATLAGGSVTFNAATIKETALNDDDRFFVGSILTPPNGGGDTIGNDDGGVGAQFGQSLRLSPATDTPTTVGNGSVSNSTNARDGDTSTSTTQGLNGDSGTNEATVEVLDFPSAFLSWKSLTLKVRNEVQTNSINTGGGIARLIWNDGTSDTDIYTLSAGTTRSLQTDSVTLPLSTNTSQITVRLRLRVGPTATSGSLDGRIYEVWIEGVS
jgi:hypothetical protein